MLRGRVSNEPNSYSINCSIKGFLVGVVILSPQSHFSGSHALLEVKGKQIVRKYYLFFYVLRVKVLRTMAPNVYIGVPSGLLEIY